MPASSASLTFPAPFVTSSVPLRLPAPAGAKATSIVQEPPGSTFLPALHVPPSASTKSPASSPPMAIPATVSVAVPVFRSVTVRLSREPTSTVPKATEAGSNVTCDLPVALPTSATSAGLPSASCVMPSVALRVPSSVGLKATATVQVAPALSFFLQLVFFAILKSAAASPAIASSCDLERRVPGVRHGHLPGPRALAQPDRAEVEARRLEHDRRLSRAGAAKLDGERREASAEADDERGRPLAARRRPEANADRARRVAVDRPPRRTGRLVGDAEVLRVLALDRDRGDRQRVGGAVREHDASGRRSSCRGPGRRSRPQPGSARRRRPRGRRTTRSRPPPRRAAAAPATRPAAPSTSLSSRPSAAAWAAPPAAASRRTGSRSRAGPDLPGSSCAYSINGRRRCGRGRPDLVRPDVNPS